MLHLKSRRTFSLVAIAAVSMAAAPAPRFSAGYTFDMESNTTVVSAMPGGGGGMKMLARGMVSPKGVMRMEVVTAEGQGAPYVTGDYFLTGDGKMMLVHPATKTYVDLADMAATAMNNLPPAVMAQMVVGDITGKTEKLDDGTPIEGRPTDHYRTTLGYSMNVMGQSIPTTVVTDYWTAKLPIKFVNPMVGGTKSPITTGPMVELVNKQIELTPKLTDAIAVKTTSVTTVSVMGQSIVTSLSAEMKNLKSAEVDDSKFVLPEGYTKAAKP